MSSSNETIGLIGAGLMGTALAGRLSAAGFHVLVSDCDASRVLALAASGAEAAENPSAVFARCERIILSLPDSKVVTALLSEAGGALRSGSVILDTSTGAPDDAVRFATSLAQRGVSYLDATVSGSSEQLRLGEALCMVGGDAATFARCGDLFATLGGHTMHVGASGDGARMKLVTNLVLGLNRAVLAEGLALAEAMGLDLPKTLAVLRASAAYSRIMDTKGEKMIAGEFAPVARLSQHLKDVRLMLHAGAEKNLPLPLSDTHRHLLERAEAEGFGALDNSAIFQVLRRPSP